MATANADSLKERLHQSLQTMLGKLSGEASATHTSDERQAALRCVVFKSQEKREERPALRCYYRGLTIVDETYIEPTTLPSILARIAQRENLSVLPGSNEQPEWGLTAGVLLMLDRSQSLKRNDPEGKHRVLLWENFIDPMLRVGIRFLKIHSFASDIQERECSVQDPAKSFTCFNQHLSENGYTDVVNSFKHTFSNQSLRQNMVVVIASDGFHESPESPPGARDSLLSCLEKHSVAICERAMSQCRAQHPPPPGRLCWEGCMKDHDAVCTYFLPNRYGSNHCRAAYDAARSEELASDRASEWASLSSCLDSAERRCRELSDMCDVNCGEREWDCDEQEHVCRGEMQNHHVQCNASYRLEVQTAINKALSERPLSDNTYIQPIFFDEDTSNTSREAFTGGLDSIFEDSVLDPIYMSGHHDFDTMRQRLIARAQVLLNKSVSFRKAASSLLQDGQIQTDIAGSITLHGPQSILLRFPYSVDVSGVKVVLKPQAVPRSGNRGRRVVTDADIVILRCDDGESREKDRTLLGVEWSLACSPPHFLVSFNTKETPSRGEPSTVVPWSVRMYSGQPLSQ